MDRSVYRAAICPQEIESSKLQANLYHMTAGRRNTVVHLASAAGNLQLIQQIMRLDLRDGFIAATNADGNTALHEAAQNGHYEVVVELLRQHRSLVNVHNNLNQIPLFKACEGGHSKIVEKLLEADASKLLDKSLDGRTCLHAVVNGGHTDLLIYLLTYIKDHSELEKENSLKETDRHGNTVLHLAARRNGLEMVTRLLEFEPALSYCLNHDKETAICVALRLGFLQIVEALINCSPDSIEIASRNGKNILHLAVEVSQIQILKFLVEKVDLSQLINQPDEAPPKDNTHGQEDRNQSVCGTPILNPNKTEINEETKPYTESQVDGNQSGGDTPLHIAARNKDFYMVDLLMKVRGVNKDAVNSAGLTPLDIARENTEYYESYKIIETLSVDPGKRRVFLYSTPKMSQLKKKKAMDIVDTFFDSRRDVELVVAALLATMTFSAVFTVPGGFHEPDSVPAGSGKNSTKTDSSVLGMPVLIEYDSFKLFLVFDCVAFFLSLFVVLVWEMSTPLTTRDKMLFICVTNAVLCMAFAFTAYGLMAAVYTVLAHKVKKFACIVLGASLLIAFCCNVAFFYMAIKFAVRRARFHFLCGVPRLLDDIVEKIWVWAEKHGIVDVIRRCEDIFSQLVSGDVCVCKKKTTGTTRGLQ